MLGAVNGSNAIVRIGRPITWGDQRLEHLCVGDSHAKLKASLVKCGQDRHIVRVVWSSLELFFRNCETRVDVRRKETNSSLYWNFIRKSLRPFPTTEHGGCKLQLYSLDASDTHDPREMDVRRRAWYPFLVVAISSREGCHSSKRL